MQGLGFDFNVVALASGVHISLRDARGVSFVVYENGGATAVTIKESIGGASEQALATVTKYWAASGIAAQVWTEETSDANGALGTGDASIVKKDTEPFDTMVFYIGADELSAGFDSVEVTLDAGTLTAFVHGLHQQRAPQNLRTVAVA